MPDQTDAPPRRTRSQKRHIYYLTDVIQRLEFDIHRHLFLGDHIPSEWNEIARNRKDEKTRITMRVNRRVVKFFRAMGPGYQARMNDVLTAFVEAYLSGMLELEEDVTGERIGWWAERARPQVGQTEQVLTDYAQRYGDKSDW